MFQPLKWSVTKGHDTHFESHKGLQYDTLLDIRLPYSGNKLLPEKNNINTYEKFSLLKNECETIVKNQKEKHTKVRNKIYSMLIGVPLGALIASIIYTGKDLNLNAVALVILISAMVSGSSILFQRISFYLNWGFKDKLMLDSLNELNYLSEIFNKPKTFDNPKIYEPVTMGKS